MSRRTARLALSVVALLAFFAALQSVAPPDGFFSGDQGPKYLQARAFAEHGPLQPGIDVASRDLDPDFHHQILEIRRGRLVGVFFWLLPLLTAPFFAALGDRGLYVVPALSAVAIFLASASLGRRLTAGDGVSIAWAVVLCAPVLFYGGELWEHAPAAACVALAAALLMPAAAGDGPASPAAGHYASRVLLAGAAIGVAALFREEAGLALPALTIARACLMPRGERIKEAIRCGGLASLGVLTIFALAIPMNMVVYGSPIPVHLSVEAGKAAAHPPARARLVAELLLPSRHGALYLVIVGIGIAAVLRARARRDAFAPVALAAACALALVVVAFAIPIWRMAMFRESMYQVFSGDSIAHTWLFCIALLFVPLLTAALPDEGRGDAAVYLCVAAALMVAGALAIVPSTGGAQWSPRYLFPSAPLLAAAAAWPAWRVTGLPPRRAALLLWTARIVLLCACAAQSYGLWFLADGKARNARITRRLADLTRPGDVVISDIPWFPQVTASLIPTRRILFARSPDEVGGIARLAADRGIHDVAVVASSAETGFRAPATLDAGAACAFTRYVRISLGERGLIVHRYSCNGPGTVVK